MKDHTLSEPAALRQPVVITDPAKSFELHRLVVKLRGGDLCNYLAFSGIRGQALSRLMVADYASGKRGQMRIKRTEKDGPLLVGLTDVECKVLAGLVRGESLKSLSVALSISPEPVLETKNALMEKLCAETTADLVRIGLVARVR